MERGHLYVISGPSGVGKGTIVSQLRETTPRPWVSISATTRAPRGQEVDGESYYFLTREAFEDLIEHGGLLEWACYNGNYYGTPLASINEHLECGEDVILEIEVQGAQQVREKLPFARLIFIEPPSFEELERRLRERGTEEESVLNERLKTARIELAQKEHYDKTFVNDDLDACVDAIEAYMASER